MFGQPSKRITLDFWTLIPELIANNTRGTLGRFEFWNGTIRPVPAVPKTQFSGGRYFIGGALPSKAEDLATGMLMLMHPEWFLERIILLVGNPTGFGNFKWRGICPHTFEPAQMLFFDWGTQLFVSRQANERNAPLSVKLAAVDQILFREFADNEEIPLAETAAQPSAALFNDQVLNFCMAESGYPVTIRNEDNEIDVLATVRNSRDRQRLPTALHARLKAGTAALRNKGTVIIVSKNSATSNLSGKAANAEAPSVSDNLTNDLKA